jgi:hypothetical protein
MTEAKQKGWLLEITMGDGTIRRQLCATREQIDQATKDAGNYLGFCEQFQNKTWGDHLANVPHAKAFRDRCMLQHGVSHGDLVDAMAGTTVRREHLAMVAIAAFAWDGDQGCGRVPRDDDFFNGEDDL